MADQIVTWLPRLSGSLRLWGVWTAGKHFDDCRQVVACEGADDLLRIDFDGGETLNIWRPRRAVLNDEVFHIAKADRVHWEWGNAAEWRPNFWDFARTWRGFAVTGSRERLPQPDRKELAVELIAVTANNIGRYQ